MPRRGGKKEPVTVPIQPDTSTPAFYTNQMQVIVNDLVGVRITWGESPEGGTEGFKGHCAVSIPFAIYPSVVLVLSDILNTLTMQGKIAQPPNKEDQH